MTHKQKKREEKVKMICFDLFNTASSNINWFNPIYRELDDMPEKYQDLFRRALLTIDYL